MPRERTYGFFPARYDDPRSVLHKGLRSHLAEPGSSACYESDMVGKVEEARDAEIVGHGFVWGSLVERCWRDCGSLLIQCRAYETGGQGKI